MWAERGDITTDLAEIRKDYKPILRLPVCQEIR